MKRKLISFDAFKQLEEQSLSTAQIELIEAEDVLSKALGVDNLKLYTFGEQDVIYQAPDGTFVHATYAIDNNNLILDNVEQLVVDEETENKRNKEIVESLFDAIVDGNEELANQKFDEYVTAPAVRRDFNEAFAVSVSKPTGKKSPLAHHKQSRSLVAKRIRSRLKTLARLSPGQKKQNARKRAMAAHQLGSSTNKRWRVYSRKVKAAAMKEWNSLCENVFGYLDYKEFGPIMAESFIQQDNSGNIVAVQVPTAHKRNENKILSFNWKTLDHEVKVLRGKVKKIAENQLFVKAMSDLKRFNNISDNEGLEQTLEAVVSAWPDLIYMTEEELTQQIAIALETANVKNYDDQICKFMAEGILRTAHNAYSDRVRKIGNLAGSTDDITAECKTCEDPYENFKHVVESFYPALDANDENDLRVFADLLKALHEVRQVAVNAKDEMTKVEVEGFMDNCVEILNRDAEIDLDLAEAIANYLHSFVESNVEGGENNWDVSNDVHISDNGDHPKMSWAAKQTDATASKYTGDWGDEAPVSDGKSYKSGLADEMRNKGWGNYSDGDTYPDLKNPYIPPAGDYKMKEKSVVNDDENDMGEIQSSDTWPNLKNPYIPSSAWDHKKVNDPDAVVDK
jgi:hypothetical protein